MEFTLQELEDIYETYCSHGILNTPVIEKILQTYTHCPLCNHLILNTEYQNHFDAHE